MSIPEPPQDIEQRKIIDKLAQFVARNGIEFENVTRENQRSNPKFSFLFGGEFHNYYLFKLSSERISVTQGINSSYGGPNSVGECSNSAWPVNSHPQLSIQDYHGGKMMIPQQFPQNHGDSLSLGHPPNLSKLNHPDNCATFNQHPMPIPTPPTSAPPMVDAITEELQSLTDQITQSEQNLTAQQAVLAQQQSQQTEEMVTLCQHEKLAKLAADTGISLQEFDQILEPIIASCTKDAISHGKQWIFQKARSEIHSLLIAQYLLRRVLSPNASFNHKLHIIYLLNDVLHHCVRKNISDLHHSLEAVVVPMFSYAILNANDEQKIKLNKLLTLWETKTNYFSDRILLMLKDPVGSFQGFQNDLLTQHAERVAVIASSIQQQFEGYRSQHEAFAQHALQRIQQLQLQQQHQQQHQQQQQQHIGAAVPLIDLSRPPPGFQDTVECPLPTVASHVEADLLPKAPYYDLPAGLMVPLINIEDHSYRALDPADIRLPPPLPPSEHLCAAVEAFYAPPERGRSRSTRPEDQPNRRDRDGWEQLGLYEFFKAKNSARRQKVRDIEDGVRESSPPITPVSSRSPSRSPSPRPPPRRYSSVSPQRHAPGSTADNTADSTERDRAPPTATGTGHRRNSRSPTPPPRRGSPASSPPPRRRSVSPPAYSGLGSGAVQSAPVQRLDESNKGHQLLKAMGWSGAGLGSQEQGIAEPVSGGHVRDRQDKFKGIGVNLHDPFESFRKNKGQAFVTRMKARAEEIAATVSKCNDD